MIHQISAGHLTLDKIEQIIKNNYQLELSEDTRQRIVSCREYLDRKVAESKEPIYGVTTGFGSLCKISIDPDQLAQLQINLMMSHACGCGERVPNDIVRIMILLKIQSLSYGYSGCKLDTVERLIDFLTVASALWSISRALWVPAATSCRWLTSACRSSDWVRWSMRVSSCRVPN